MAYPWRVVWRKNPSEAKPACPQFLIVVPKKRLRHAVDRVRMRRLMREAYRLNKHLIPADAPIDIAFIYVANNLTSFADTQKSLIKILSRICLKTSAADSKA